MPIWYATIRTFSDWVSLTSCLGGQLQMGGGTDRLVMPREEGRRDKQARPWFMIANLGFFVATGADP